MACAGCQRTVIKTSRGIATCTLVKGSDSEQLSYSRFAVSEDRRIPDFDKECTTSMYMYLQRNILSNGLATVIPQLCAVVFALKWQTSFNKFTIVSKEEIDAQMEDLSHFGFEPFFQW